MLSEAKVGALFFAGLGAAIGFTLFVRSSAGHDGAYSVRFDRVQGLGPGDAVLYNGIDVGAVTRVVPTVIDGEPSVRVEFDLSDEIMGHVLINEATAVSIDKGMLGGTHLTVNTTGPGAVIDQPHLDALRGLPPSSLSDAVTTIDETVSENRPALNRAIEKLPEAIDNFSAAAGEIRDLVAENRPNVKRTVVKIGDMGAAIEDLVAQSRERIREAINNIAAMGAQIRDLVAENRPNLKRTVDKLPDAVAAFDGAASEIQAAIAANRANLDRLMGSLARTGPKLERIGTNVDLITAQIASGEGTLGKLVFDDGLHDQASEVLTTAERRLEEIKPITSGFADLKIFVGLKSGYNADRENFHNTLYLRIEPRPWKFYEAGITDRTAPVGRDTNREDPDELNLDWELRFGWRFFPDDALESYRLTLRGGLIEGKLGGQADVVVVPHCLTLSAMLRGRHDDRDPNDRRFEDGDGLYGRVWAEARVWKRCYASVGVDDVIDRSALWVGLRAELLDNDIRNALSASAILP